MTYKRIVLPVLEEKVLQVVKEKFKDQLDELAILESNLKDLKNKINKLEERFINEEIPLDLYKKFNEKFLDEELKLKQQMQNLKEVSANFEFTVKKGLKIAQNIGQVWVSANFDYKSKLQKLVFPEGLSYNRKKHELRTFKVNSLFSAIPPLARVSGQKKIDQLVKTDRKSRLVVLQSILWFPKFKLHRNREYFLIYKVCFFGWRSLEKIIVE